MRMADTVVSKIKAWAQHLQQDIVALWFACQDRRTPRLAKALAIFTVGYALSPIDLIPDFIPVIGFIDDAILLPALIWLVLRLIPLAVMTDCRVAGQTWLARGNSKPVIKAGVIVIVALWLALACGLWFALSAHGH